MKNLLFRLADTCIEKQPVGIYIRPEKPDRFIVGYIETYDDQWLLVSLITPERTSDGYLCCSWSKIYRLETGSVYIDSLNTNQKKRLFYNRNSQTIWENICTYLTIRQPIVKVLKHCAHRSIYGKLITYTSNTITIRRITRSGMWKGFLTIKDDEIANLSFN